jgi:basic amino acid/polyamine antiporter, APA family
MSWFRKKSLASVVDQKGVKLKRTLGAFDLFLMGLGAIVGTGIFVITGITAAEVAGPAVTISYLLAGVSCVFVALAYTEVATMIPTSGSVYAYSYVALGELFAWVIGWMMIMYLVISATTVASGWSGYMVSILQAGGIELPHELISIPSEGGIINLPAVFVSLLVAGLLMRGTKESAMINGILVLVKIVAIFLFVFIAAPDFDAANWWKDVGPFDESLVGSSNFMPFGAYGVLTGAGLVFFGYNGFDTLASAIEEAKNPRRDITIAILASLVVCILLYMLVSGILVGVVPYNELGNASPLAYALSKLGSNTGSALVATGAVTGMTTVILMQCYAASRVIFVVSRDGLLPKSASKIHDKFGTPYISIIAIGLCVALISGVAPLSVMGSLASLGALFSYITVCFIMLYLRIKWKDVDRPFRCPAAFVIGGVAIILCAFLAETLLMKVGNYFIGWLLVGLAVYFLYARKGSAMNKLS